MSKSRASTSEAARRYRQEGHDNATIFALLIGLDAEYQNDKKAKKDVIDPSGDAHSVKSGAKKWQIFLYGRSRFVEDDGFQALNGIGTLLIHCIDAFPPSFDQYRQNPAIYKERLTTPMRELKDRFQRKALLRAFLSKSIFNAGEVDYLTVLDDDQYHVFHNSDVVRYLGNNFTVENSVKRTEKQFSDQKVLFKYQGLNVGELEMRNDSRQHYQEVRFNVNRNKAMEMLYAYIPERNQLLPEVVVYGNAIGKFGNWINRK